MHELITLVIVLAVGGHACRQAMRGHAWSWGGFGWTLLLVAAYALLSMAAGIGLLGYVGEDQPLLGTLCVLLPIMVGIVPLTILARHIRRRYPHRP
ncbi:MAG: hypothetical protein P4L71_11965 [Acetobacteraceae bacterium]|nr:hypothetical protein [Acetobacteraceae bacterium]